MIFNILFVSYCAIAGFALYKITKYLFDDPQSDAARGMAETMRRIGRPEEYGEQELEDYRNRQAEIAQSFDF